MLPAHAQTWITNSLTLSETNTTYDGLDLVISGAGVTVAMDGPHAFNSLLLTNGAVLTHSPCTGSQTHKLEITVSNAVVVSADSRIDVSGKGYLSGYTSGNTTVGAATQVSGGGYGGLGGGATGGGSPPGFSNPAYGDYADPADWGSGGAADYAGRPWIGMGGGLLRLRAGTLWLDGRLVANGADTLTDGYGAGAGGGILVAVQILGGSGRMEARGGNTWNAGGYPGAGGGGRVAVYAQDFSGFPPTNITALGGTGGVPGGAGSVYLRDTDEALGTLLLDGSGGGNGWTALGLAGTNRSVIPDLVVIRGGNTHVQPVSATHVLEFLTNVVVTDFAQLTLVGSSTIFHAPLLVDSGARVDVSGDYTLPFALDISNGSHLSVSGVLTLARAFSLTGGSSLQVGAGLTVLAPLTVSGSSITVGGPVITTVPLGLSGSSFTINGPLTSSVPVTVNGGTLTVDALVAPQLALTNGAVLNCLASTAAQMHKLEINVAGAITVSTNSRIDVSGKGYLSGYTSGNTTVGAATQVSGGGYGGLGGGATGGSSPPGFSNPAYGDYADPADWGSGGAADHAGRSWIGMGGGLLRLRAGTLWLDGRLVANGADTLTDGYGAGAGGGILVAVQILGASGRMEARGGNTWNAGGYPGAGGGGRVAVYAQDFSGFPSPNITALGGTGGVPGGAGSVWLAVGRLGTHAQYSLPGLLKVYPTNGLVFLAPTRFITNCVSIQFNNRIATNSFTFDKFLIQGPLGAVVPRDIYEIGDRLYRIAFPPQTEQGAYHFTLLPTLLDAEGFQLDQNANGTPGEASDAYTFTLILDSIPPRVTQHAPAGDVAGTVSSVDVWLSEVLDTNSLNSSTVTIRNPAGGSIPASSFQALPQNRWRIGFAPQVNVGLYHVLLSTKVTDLAGNPLAVQSDPNPPPPGFAYDAWFNLVPLDLQLSDVLLSTNLFWAGHPVEVAWSGRNASGAPLLGRWFDGVYLSQDDRWDINDVLLATLPHEGGLASNEVYAAATRIFVPGALPGGYHLLLRADIYGQEKEGTNRVNNVTALPIQLAVPELTLGVSQADVFLTNGHARYYQVTVPDAADLRATLDLAATSGATELYIRREAIPTRVTFDAKYSAPFQPDQTNRVPGTQAGTYYLLAYADTVPVLPAPFTILTETLPFALTGVTPNHGGNAGNVTLRLTGSGITSNSTAKLVYAGSNGVPVEVLSIRTRRQDMGQMLATFDLRGIAPTLADVVLVDEAGQILSSSNSFRVEPRNLGELRFQDQGPSGIRPDGRPSLFSVRITNVSNQDADLVALRAWVQNQPGLQISVRGPLDVPAVASGSGFLPYLLPKIMVGEVANVEYEVRIDGRYQGSSFGIHWELVRVGQTALLQMVAERMEADRLSLLTLTNLQAEMPELYSLATNRSAWRSNYVAYYDRLGFDFSDMDSAGTRSLKDAGGCDGYNDRYIACQLHCLYCSGQGPIRIKLPDCKNCMANCMGDQQPCTPPPPPPPPPYIPIVRSWDPNEKRSFVGWGPQAHTAQSETLRYSVAFENLAMASGAATQVSIVDQLSSALDWQTFALTEIGFAGVKLPVPSGLSHFETRVPFSGWTWNASNGWHRGETPLMVDVKAGIDVQTGLISVTLTCSDTNTGFFPEDAFAGFLPPNRPELAYFGTNGAACCGSVDTNVLIQPGQGYVSYTVRPKTNLASGTGITNAASIYFDYNDPIDTSPVFNTIDAGTPISSVLALPAESGRTFRLQWAGADDPGGSGVASYDLYVSSDATNYTRWLEGTAETGAWFVGERGRSYYFYSVARDWVGHEQPRPQFAQAFTTIPTNAPVLAVVTNSSILPGSALTITNAVQGTPAGQWLFSLGVGAPSGAIVNPTNGVFRWTPTCAQATTTNTLTVWVTDSGRTNLMDAMNFTVVVRECVQPTLGQQVLLAGQSGHVPVWLISTVPLTNLSMTLVAPAERLTGYSLEKLVPQICTNTITPFSNDLHRLNFVACPGKSLIGTQQVAWLNFTTVSNQSSAFVKLEFTDLLGRMADGTPVANFAPQSGRVVVLGEEPLLEIVRATNSQPLLILYGKPASGYTVETRPDLSIGTWQAALPGLAITTNLWLDLPSPASASRENFYRAVRP